jgi:outer membrane protein assembly factor BamB
LGAERTARCYDASTGNVIWSRRLPGEFRDEFFASSFVVAGDTALVACGPLVALSTDDGQVRWQGDAPLDYQSHSSPAVWDAGTQSVALVNTAGGKTQAYRISDGHKLWELQAGAGQSTPIVAGNFLLTYGSSRKSGLSAYRLAADAPDKQPELAWQFQRAADSGSTPVVRGDAVFVQGEKRLAKVRLSDGDTLWQTTMKISNPRYTSLIAAGDQLFFGWEGLLSFKAEGDDFVPLYEAKVDSESVLIGASDLRAKLKLDQISKETDGLEKSEKLWQQNAVKSGPLACSTPAISDGWMVIRLRDAVVCYDLRL